MSIRRSPVTRSVPVVLRRIYAFTFFQFALFHGPVIIIFYQSRGLSLHDIYTLQTLHYGAKLVAEVPAGIYADRYKRKYALALGAMLPAVAYVGISFSRHFLWFALFEILAGFGRSLISGADSALIYDTLKRQDQIQRYHRAEATNFAVLNVAFIAYALFSGYIANIDLSLPYLFSAAFIGIAGLIALTIVEPAHDHALAGPRPAMTHLGRLAGAARAIRGTRELLFVSAFGAVFLCLRELNFYTEQPLLRGIGIELRYFGVLPAIGALLWAVTSYLSPRVIEALGHKASFVASGLLFVLPALFLSQTGYRPMGLGLYAVFYLAYGLQEPLARMRSNGLIEDSSVRATVLSMQSGAGLVMYCCIAPCFGTLLDTRSLQSGYGVLAAIAGVLLLYVVFHVARSGVRRNT